MSNLCREFKHSAASLRAAPRPATVAPMDFIPPKTFKWNYCGTCGAKLAEAHDGQDVHPHCAVCRRFYYYNPVPAACCFAAKPDGALLYVRRAVEPCKGGWSLPGGFMELGESPEECVVRELCEETRLRGTQPRLIGAATRGSPMHGAVLVLGYLMEEWDGEDTMQAGTDAMEVAFFLPDARPELVFDVHRELLTRYDALQAKKGLSQAE